MASAVGLDFGRRWERGRPARHAARGRVPGLRPSLRAGHLRSQRKALMALSSQRDVN